MFSTLLQGSQVYILNKPSSLKIGKVVTIHKPTAYTNYLLNSTVDISVSVENETTEFKLLPSSSGIAYYDNGKTIISDNKDLIVNEVDSMIKESKEILDNIPYHEQVVSSGEEMLKMLNPQYAKLKELEDKINNLEFKVGNMEDKLDNIASMLTKALLK